MYMIPNKKCLKNILLTGENNIEQGCLKQHLSISGDAATLNAQSPHDLS